MSQAQIIFSDVFDFKGKSSHKAGDGYSEGEYPFFTSSEVQTKFLNEYDYQGPCIIFGTGGSANVHFCENSFATSADCLVASVKNDRADIAKYFYFFLASNLHVLEAGFRGAGLKHISKRFIENLIFPYASPRYQKQIVLCLNKADSIRRRRQESIRMTEAFLRSAFLEMFGDPAINSKDWSNVPLREFCSDIVDCPHSTPNYSSEITGFPCIRSSDLQNGRLVFESTKYVNNNVYMDRIKRLKPNEGDIIFCREGARLGNSAIIPTGITPCLGQRTMLFRIDNKVATPEYLILLLNDPMVKQQISAKVIGAAAPRINVSELIELMLMRPPLDLQEKYSVIYKKIDVLRKNQLMSYGLSTNIEKALVQKAFRGEL
jgi:type I restriction enzyme S subunit